MHEARGLFAFKGFVKKHSSEQGLIMHVNILWNTNLKSIYSEKAKKFCEIFTLLLSYVVPVKSNVKISQNFVTFSKYMNFK